MRILITCDWFSPDTGGGAERVAFEVSKHLALAGNQVTILATLPREREPFRLPSEIDLTTVPAYSLSRLLRAQVSVSPTLPSVMAAVLGSVRPDVVWAHSLQFQTTLAGVLWARQRRIPYVVTAHIADLRAIHGPVGAAARVHEATVGRLILRFATRAIAVSEPVATHLRTLDAGVAVDIVPNGVDLGRFRPTTPARRARFRVGFMGRLIPNKGPDVAVRAIARLHDAGVDTELSIAGLGPEASHLRRLAADLEISDLVRFEGHVPEPQAWLRGIDVLVRPSLTEGMPLGVLEAMAAGVPIVATDIPGNAALLAGVETVGILIPVGDDAALADALARLERDLDLRLRLSAGGIRIAASRSWEETSRQTADALRRAVEGLPRPDDRRDAAA